MQVAKTHLRWAIHNAMELAQSQGKSGVDLADAIADTLAVQFSVQKQFEDIDNYAIPSWLGDLAYQQQSVVLLALRGPDGIPKHHVSKRVHIAYRGTVLRAAARGRFLDWGEGADTFMSMDVIAQDTAWEGAVNSFFYVVDELPHHYVSHLAHAAQIIGYKHPDERFRRAWGYFYLRWCDDKHVNPETEYQMDKRLSDWGMAQGRLGQRGILFQYPHEAANAFTAPSCGCSSCRDEEIECVAIGEQDDNPFHPESPEGRAFADGRMTVDGVVGE
ncbi:hypothetical protein J2J97_32425 (plasmid) [Rhizobium bangladeshense]|uniref:hypothetical protein n=1 Tax=Rhizobium bangladeshense TaxID=1138189 RepID=UPI001A99374C|nr:hypothetical protein [Rhizobium bangladeshense]QSY98612.1 hypothetical protein J2J97_32425 [Rhizobium bangladeshense]